MMELSVIIRINGWWSEDTGEVVGRSFVKGTRCQAPGRFAHGSFRCCGMIREFSRSSDCVSMMTKHPYFPTLSERMNLSNSQIDDRCGECQHHFGTLDTPVEHFLPATV